jgi:hypothetical protein
MNFQESSKGVALSMDSCQSESVFLLFVDLDQYVLVVIVAEVAAKRVAAGPLALVVDRVYQLL